MSTITKEWTVELIRDVIKHLDEKTGLNGAALPIKMGMAKNPLGYFNSEKGNECFYFSKKYLNNPNFYESEAIELIRHEYAHYYVEAANISQWISPGRAWHHGPDWRYACEKVGASGRRCYNPAKLMDDINVMQAEKLMKADDVERCNILEYINTWKTIPLWNKEKERQNFILKNCLEEFGYFVKGDKFIHKENGFGVVMDTHPQYTEQLLYVQYENGLRTVTTTKDIYKIVDGIVRTKKH